MLADDIRPSRLSEAKDLIESFLTHPSIDQYGLIIFAGKPFLLSPLTEDHRALSEIITSVTTDTIRQNLP